MKPFDASAVTLGTPVIVKQFQGAVTPGRYLAKMEDGRHVVEMVAVNGTHFVNVFDDGCIFMAPKKRTMYVNLYPHDYLSRVGSYTTWDTVEQAAEAAKNMRSIATVVPIEIED